MKAVVMEIKEKDMVVMDQQGIFHKLKYDCKSSIGDEILFNESRKNTIVYMRKITAIAAMLLLVLTSGYGAISYYSPYAYVDIDINPSVELVLNRYMRVLEVHGLNEDAKKIIPDVSEFKNKKMDQAVEIMLGNAESMKILTEENENTVMFTVSGVDNNSVDNIKKDLKDVTKKKLAKLIKEENILTEKIPIQKHDDAKKLKVSPGRIILFEKLKEVKPDATIQDVESMPVRETVKMIKEYKKAKMEMEKEERKENIQEKRQENIEKIRQQRREQKEDNKTEKEQIEIQSENRSEESEENNQKSIETDNNREPLNQEERSTYDDNYNKQIQERRQLEIREKSKRYIKRRGESE